MPTAVSYCGELLHDLTPTRGLAGARELIYCRGCLKKEMVWVVSGINNQSRPVLESRGKEKTREPHGGGGIVLRAESLRGKNGGFARNRALGKGLHRFIVGSNESVSAVWGGKTPKMVFRVVTMMQRKELYLPYIQGRGRESSCRGVECPACVIRKALGGWSRQTHWIESHKIQRD